MKIKIFFIINSFSSGGGSQSLLTTVANALDDTGRYVIGIMEIIHDVVKVEPIHDTIKMYPYYVEADAVDRKEKMYHVYRDWDNVISMYIPQDYDIYISWNYLKPTFLLPIGKKNIAWIHGDIYDLINKYPEQTLKTDEIDLQREAFKKVQRIVAISENTRRSIYDIYPEYENKIRVINNGINIEKIRNKSEEKTDIELKDNSVIFVGRLDRNKNPLRAIRVFLRFREYNKNAHLYFMGIGALRDELEEIIRCEQLGDFVHFLGYVDNPFPVMKQARVLLMTSFSEGFPMALLESLTLGVPVVTTDVGGTLELTQNGECTKVFVDDEQGAIALEYYFEQNRDLITKKAKAEAELFGLDRYVEKIEGLLYEVYLNSQDLT